MDDHDHSACGSGDEFAVIPAVGSCGHQHVVRHHPDHSLELGTVLHVPDGKPLPSGAEIVTAKALGDGRYAIVDSVKVGPAQVATKQYREGWDRVFGKNAVN
jgi:hypothetical protein